MSVLAIERTGYLDAVDHLRLANHDAADGALVLSRTLQGYAGMAGSTSVAHDVARQYDAAARAALRAHLALARALAELGRTAERSLANHTRAETASQLTYAFDEGDLETGPGDWNVAVTTDDPPTSLGANPVALPGWATEIMSHLESFVWPDADVARLRSAASTWRAAGERLEPIHRHLQDAAARLALERSPEIPLAQEVLARARAAVIDLEVAHHRIGALCEEYAAQVESHCARLLDILGTVRDIGLTTLGGAALGPVTLGVSTVVAAQRNLERINALLPRLLDVLRSLADVARGLGGELSGTTADLTSATDRLHAMSGVAESAETTRSDGPTNPWLAMHEKPPGHTYRDHVGLSDEELHARLARKPSLVLASTYPDEETAVSTMKSALQAHEKDIADWLATNPARPKRFDIDTADTVGRVLDRGEQIVETTSARVVLIPDPTFPQGVHILTSFPITSGGG